MIGGNGIAMKCLPEIIFCTPLRTGQELLFLSLDLADVIERAGPSHDVGKLQKEEWRTVQRH